MMGTKSTGNILCRCYGEEELEREHGNVPFTKMQQAVELEGVHCSGSRVSDGTIGCTQ